MEAFNPFYKLGWLAFGCRCGCIQRFFHMAVIFQYALACQRFNTAHAGSNTGFGNDFKQRNICRVGNMSTTTEFL